MSAGAADAIDARAHRSPKGRFHVGMTLMEICANVVCAGYWYHAGEELGYPRWFGAVGGSALFLVMNFVWPGGVLLALGAQVVLAVAIGAIGTYRLGRDNR